AKTLGAIACDLKSFYQGWIAGAIADLMAQQGGKISQEDLPTYTPLRRSPICGTYCVFQVCSMPPPLLGVLLLCKCSIFGNYFPLLPHPLIAVTTSPV
ncbi:MAG TPA: gamma-glutamyltransferase, partial [Thermosynechococcus sp. M46_R2017_013]|nr:gamma-glutamyltransferase [Thermosynechococcus sp. M46_R2017_013]